MKYYKLTTLILGMLLMSTWVFGQKNPETTEVWEPEPAIVTPSEVAGGAPSDAIILFDGKNSDEWVQVNGDEVKWEILEGTMTVKRGTGAIKTRKEFGDIQLHLEWRSPTEIVGEGQGRGNSGVFFMERYEVQILDSYNNRTYSNGQASSVYKQHIPLANAMRPPGEWQVYDIIFTAPRFSERGKLLEAARVTVIHNGVLTQNNVSIWGPMQFIGLPSYKAHGKASLQLQDHGNPVSFKNIWIRQLD
jgi:hypothetical protein